MNQGCLCKLLCPLPLPPLPCALTGLFIVLPLLCLLSQACVCWLLTGFGLKDQLVADVRTGNGGDIRVAGYFPLFLYKLVILIEVVASSIKQIHQMAWVWVPANCIPHSCQPLSNCFLLFTFLGFPCFLLGLYWLTLLIAVTKCLAEKQPKRRKICFGPRSRHRSWEGGMSGLSPTHASSWRLFAHVSLVRKQREREKVVFNWLSSSIFINSKTHCLIPPTFRACLSPQAILSGNVFIHMQDSAPL